MVTSPKTQVIQSDFVLPTCTEVTAESSYCSVAGITESTFCIYDSDVPSDGTPETIYAATSSACTIKDGLKSALADPPDYLIYKQKSGAGNEKIFTEGFGTSKDDQHVVFKATAASKVAPQNDIYVYDSSNKNLVACNNEYLCKITTTAGLYYSANTRSVIRCDGKACAPEVYVGVYYLASKIYRCTGSSTVVCVEGDKVDYNASFDNASHGGKFALNVNDIVYGLSAWKNVLNIAATTTTYRIISKDLADPLFGLNLAADGKVLAKITKEYAIKGKKKKKSVIIIML
ncbi:hypothetical protein PIROE2DRAFT_57778 [Piromyces sp. E2]|nr:hypothetical protein PIROE2DRAFT_57778 [Piromyces sp. E2]|eukprot:OUM68921.1 hypothetical protein PIROE2DRAFT_57778 [Piromyces sp. E2]